MGVLKRYNGIDWEPVGAASSYAHQSGTTIGFSPVTTNQGSILTEVDLTGLAVMVTVPEGRRIRITGYTLQNSASANTTFILRIKEGATQLVESQVGQPSAGNGYTNVAQAVITPTAGTHTYKLTGQATSTTTLLSSSISPSFILVEDISGSTLPYDPASIPVGSLGQAFATANQGSITTETDITGLSINVSVPAGRTLKIRAEMYLQNNTVNAAAGARMFIKEGSTYLQQADHRLTATGVPEKFIAEAIVSPTAGTHTYNVRVDNGGGGTVTMVAGAGFPSVFYVQDITPTPAPGSGAPGSTLGYAEVATNQTGIGAGPTDITGLSVNITVPAGRRIRITGRIAAYSYSDTTTAHQILIQQDGVDVGRVNIGPQLTSTAFFDSGMGEAIITPSAGSHTYKLYANRYIGAGTLTINNSSTIPSFILVEDITGAVWPEGSPVTGGMIASEPWTTYSPTFTNFTLGNGTVVARYQKIGRKVTVYIKITLGTTSVMGTQPKFTLPVAISSTHNPFSMLGTFFASDVTTNINPGFFQYNSSDGLVQLRVMSSDSTNVGFRDITSTVPITWNQDDLIDGLFTYEAAS